jgi:hypothetical protein
MLGGASERRTIVKVFALLAALAAAPLLCGQAGHWQGSIQTPGPELGIIVDLAQDAQGAWTGAISIPDQNLKGFPLSDIVVNGKSVKFAMKGIPGDPLFEGKLAEDGKTIAGPFTQGGGAMTFKMTRAGDAAFAKSTPITKELEGNWEGTLDANGTQLRLITRLANKDGVGTGTMISVDQGGAEIPITAVIQKGTTVDLQLPKIGGSYLGELNKDATQITGEWTQGMGKFPLVLKRAAK